VLTVVGSMFRQRPSLVLMGTPENARVAVSSRGFASAAADGFRMVPARETVTTPVAASTAAAVLVAASVIVAGAAETAALAGAGAASAAPAAAPPPAPNVKSSAPLADATGAETWSSRPFLTVRIVFPAPFSGASAIGPAPPVNANCWLFVTSPPPSARPPHEKRRTWLPAARRGSKLRGE
jgi:hypothetical protein